jgi:hypothetical protein
MIFSVVRFYHSYLFPLTVDAVKAAITTWRTTDDGHLPAMLWSFLGGQPDQGGSEVGVWGENGGLFTKIIKCDDIPDKFMYYQYPNGVATSDFIDPETNETISEMIYQWWTEYGGYDETGEQQFGEAFKLTQECAGCAEAFACFDDFCEFIDWEARTWDASYSFCDLAAPCAFCFSPICSPPEQPTSCSICANGVPEANQETVVDPATGTTCEALRLIAPTFDDATCQSAAPAEFICCPDGGPSGPDSSFVCQLCTPDEMEFAERIVDPSAGTTCETYFSDPQLGDVTDPTICFFITQGFDDFGLDVAAYCGCPGTTIPEDGCQVCEPNQVLINADEPDPNEPEIFTCETGNNFASYFVNASYCEANIATPEAKALCCGDDSAAHRSSFGYEPNKFPSTATIEGRLVFRRTSTRHKLCEDRLSRYTPRPPFCRGKLPFEFTK